MGAGRGTRRLEAPDNVHSSSGSYLLQADIDALRVALLYPLGVLPKKEQRLLAAEQEPVQRQQRTLHLLARRRRMACQAFVPADAEQAMHRMNTLMLAAGMEWTNCQWCGDDAHYGTGAMF